MITIRQAFKRYIKNEELLQKMFYYYETYPNGNIYICLDDHIADSRDIFEFFCYRVRTEKTSGGIAYWNYFNLWFDGYEGFIYEWKPAIEFKDDLIYVKKLDENLYKKFIWTIQDMNIREQYAPSVSFIAYMVLVDNGGDNFHEAYRFNEHQEKIVRDMIKHNRLLNDFDD